MPYSQPNFYANALLRLQADRVTLYTLVNYFTPLSTVLCKAPLFMRLFIKVDFTPLPMLIVGLGSCNVVKPDESGPTSQVATLH